MISLPWSNWSVYYLCHCWLCFPTGGTSGLYFEDLQDLQRKLFKGMLQRSFGLRPPQESSSQRRALRNICLSDSSMCCSPPLVCRNQIYYTSFSKWLIYHISIHFISNKLAFTYYVDWVTKIFLSLWTLLNGSYLPHQNIYSMLYFKECRQYRVHVQIELECYSNGR